MSSRYISFHLRRVPAENVQKYLPLTILCQGATCQNRRRSLVVYPDIAPRDIQPPLLHGRGWSAAVIIDQPGLPRRFPLG